jgi:hypothetical protein
MLKSDLVGMEAFRNKHKGEEMIILASGPSLMDVAPGFLVSRVNIAVNFFTWWMPFIKPDYWIGLDPIPMENLRSWQLKDTPKFVPTRLKEDVARKKLPMDGVVWFGIDEEHEGMGYDEEQGTMKYSTSSAGALHLAIWMGAKRVFVVGFDCTVGKRGTGAVVGPGMTHVPHFFDRDKDHRYKSEWDKKMGIIARHGEANGVEVLNCSRPTAAKSLKIADWRDYYEREVEVYDKEFVR